MKCINCGYLSDHVLDHQGSGRVYHEYSRSEPVSDWRFTRCYRHRWTPPGADRQWVQREISRDRLICRTAYPYSEGSPEEHRVSHRARTTRRWLVAGAFFGPFGAAAAAGVAAQGPGLDVQATSLLLAGAALFLAAVVLTINLVFIRD